VDIYLCCGLGDAGVVGAVDRGGGAGGRDSGGEGGVSGAGGDGVEGEVRDEFGFFQARRSWLVSIKILSRNKKEWVLEYSGLQKNNY